jgi:hypothetical protein
LAVFVSFGVCGLRMMNIFKLGLFFYCIGEDKEIRFRGYGQRGKKIWFLVDGEKRVGFIFGGF